MAEISNRVLAALLVVAIVVSLGGTLISLNKIRQIPLVPVTGFATTGAGYANLSIEAVAGIEINQPTIDFGTGHTSQTSGSNCTMWINGTKGTPDPYSKTSDCAGEWNSTWETGETPIIIENIGTSWVQINASSNVTDSEFLPTDHVDATWGDSGRVEWWFQDNETGACNDTNVSNTNYGQWLNVTKAPSSIIGCQCLNFTDTKDSLALGMKLEIPNFIDPDYVNKELRMKINITAVDLGAPASGKC